MSGWWSRLTSLNGEETRTTSLTPGMARRFSVWNCSRSPTRPMMVRVTPRLTNASPPAFSTRVTTASTFSAAAPGAMTTTMLCLLRTEKSPGRMPGARSAGAVALERFRPATRPRSLGPAVIEPVGTTHGESLTPTHPAPAGVPRCGRQAQHAGAERAGAEHAALRERRRGGPWPPRRGGVRARRGTWPPAPASRRGRSTPSATRPPTERRRR